jgi:hypothetical protein
MKATIVFAGAAVAMLYAALGKLPLISDDYSVMNFASERFHEVTDALDPRIFPHRPLQMLHAYGFSRSLPPDPRWARIPAHLLHFGVAVLLLFLPRLFGGDLRSGTAATVLFLAFPNARNLMWCSTMSEIGRAFAILAGLLLFGWWRRRRRILTGAGTILAFIVALGFKQNGLVLAILMWLWVFLEHFRDGGSWHNVVREVRDPVLVATSILAAANVLMLATDLYSAYHGMQSRGTIPVSLVKASVCCWPQPVREIALDGLRGNYGLAGQIMGAGWTAGTVLLLVFWGIRSGLATRLLLLGAGLDVGVYSSVGGFTPRYFYLSSTFVCCALGLLVAGTQGSSGPKKWRFAALILIFLAWAGDHVLEVIDLRSIGTQIETLLDQAVAERQRITPGKRVTIIDPPLSGGRGRDVAIFDWGFLEALKFRGFPDGWELVRRAPAPERARARVLPPAEVDAMIESPKGVILDYDPETGRFVRYP